MSEPTEIFLFDFRGGATTTDWEVVCDDVMGGISTGGFARGTEGMAVFSGEVSLANSGGFAAVRCRPRLFNLASFPTLVVKARGDGRRYRFTFRVMPSFDYILHQATFVTQAGQWLEHRFSFSDFISTFRGRILTDAPAPDLTRIASLGFLVADRQAGPFRLECEWIKAIAASRE